jgi:hypothetical protein
MKIFAKFLLVLTACSVLSGCLVTSVVGTAVSAATSVVSGAVSVVDAVTPDIID